MKVAVVGIGYVGLVTACALASSGHNVLGVEKDQKKLKLLKNGKCPIYEEGIDKLLKEKVDKGILKFTNELREVDGSDIVFITVGTPSLANGQVDLSQVYGVIEELINILTYPTVLVMKSTVPPGTGEKIKNRFLNHTSVPISYVSNPEFLRESKALWDWYHPDRIIIGGDDYVSMEKVKKLYSNVSAPVITMDITSAEMVKYASNAFLATKISFINEIANLCELVGAKIDYVSKGVGMDKRIGSEFLQAGLGYGGSCFPKDTKGLDYISSFNGYSFKLLKSVIEVNTYQRISCVRKLLKGLGRLNNKKIGILGLSFKPNTDDIREAPALDIIPLLISEGAIVSTYDPLAVENARQVLPPAVIFNNNVYECIAGCNALVLATEWSEFQMLDWEKVKGLMKQPFLIIDGRNVLDQNYLLGLGFKYIGFGR